MLPHYRSILAIASPKTDEAPQPEPELEPGGTSSPPQAVDGGEQHPRSPFPVFGLQWAMRHAKFLHDHAGPTAVSLYEAARAWELDPNSRDHFQTVDDLLHFGIIEQIGSGTARQIHISELGRRWFAHPDEAVRSEALSEAARTPKMLADYAVRWRGGRPADDVCIAALIGEHGFTEKMAASFLWTFGQCIFYIERSSKFRADDPSGLAEAEQQNKLTVVQRGCRLAIHADVDVAGLDRLGETLVGYEMILQLWAPDRGAGSATA